MFPAALGKNDAFGPESVNHNSAMQLGGRRVCRAWRCAPEVQRGGGGAQSQSLAEWKGFNCTTECIMTVQCMLLHRLHATRYTACTLQSKTTQCIGLQSNAVISALALILGKVRGCVSRSVDRSPIVGRTSAQLLRHASQTHWKSPRCLNGWKRQRQRQIQIQRQRQRQRRIGSTLTQLRGSQVESIWSWYFEETRKLVTKRQTCCLNFEVICFHNYIYYKGTAKYSILILETKVNYIGEFL